MNSNTIIFKPRSPGMTSMVPSREPFVRATGREKLNRCLAEIRRGLEKCGHKKLAKFKNHQTNKYSSASMMKILCRECRSSFTVGIYTFNNKDYIQVSKSFSHGSELLVDRPLHSWMNDPKMSNFSPELYCSKLRNFV